MNVFYVILRGFFRLRLTIVIIIEKIKRISTLESPYKKINDARKGFLYALIRILISFLKNMKIMAPGRSL